MISTFNYTQTETNANAPVHYHHENSLSNGLYKNATAGEIYDAGETFDAGDATNYEFGIINTAYENTSLSASIQISNFTGYGEIPYYIKATSMTFCIAIMCLGVIGNVMVPIVILKTKDMRNSTNIFLVNLSIADLMVLLVCTPTVLVEVNSKPETWVLGKELCLAVPFVELTVTHASVLTILAISFERYYAICEPLRAGYVCTKTRATLICALVWFFAALFTSPILAIAEHHSVTHHDGTVVSQCLTQAVNFWEISFFVMIIVLLYVLPLIVLVVLYSVIAKNLITAASKVVMNKTVDPYNARARKQVILMLGTVVLCFFLCLMPYRALTLWIIITPSGFDDVSSEKWYNILYFSRVMLYINSAINPILYNLMSSKFRIGFCKVCICYKNEEDMNRRTHRTITNGSTTSSSLTRTTNSLRKFFGHRGSVDKIETDSKDEEKSLFDKLFPNKTFVRQQSAPVCSTNNPNRIDRMRSEGNFDIDKIEDFSKVHSGLGKNVRTSVDSNMPRVNSLRRSVLLNSARGKSVDSDKKSVSYQKVSVDCVVAFQNSRSIDHYLPSSFV